MSTFRKTSPLPFFFLAGILTAQIPAGYYDSTAELGGSALQQALHDIIDGHTVLSYTSLWTHVQATDKKPDGTVWDIYSDLPGQTPPYSFTFVSDQCGNYSAEGDCYNREHSWPKSWFDDTAPMNSDLFHIYPTDGYVNGRRGNYPYGAVAAPTWISENGSRLGPCSCAGYAGTVFEPIDEYKGDLARTYFYMSVRYYREDSGWPGSDMTDGARLRDWALALLLDWNAADPVSQKELDRNDSVYVRQHNRNPFIDHPEYATRIWVDSLGTEPAPLPPDFRLGPAYPNPANPVVWFDLQTDRNGSVRITVLDIAGRMVAGPLELYLTAGTHSLHWAGTTGGGAAAASGLYFIRVTDARATATRKVVLLR